ncbi:MAG: UDP-N-acetylmuramoyl-L-alanine--D-glutamate ligase [Pseudomonadales bacterium]
MNKQASTSAKTTLVVGAGTTGLSVLRHLYGQEPLVLIDTRGPEVFGADAQAELPAVQTLLDADRVHLETQLNSVLPKIRRAVLSPGLSEDHWLLRRLRDENISLCTDIDLFFAAVDVPVIGITGTNGKSTVTSLVATLLSAVGLRARAGGNLGPAALDLLSEDADAFVLELSSFQLARSERLPYRVACILNICPDHLDYHGTMSAYIEAKQRIYTAATHAVYAREDAETYPNSGPDGGPAARSSFGLDAPALGDVGVLIQNQTRWLVAAVDSVASPWLVLPCAELGIPGRHNESNALAALAMVLALLPEPPDSEALAEALRGFSGLPHRCERVAVVNDVTFINDSKATNVGATVAAVEGLRSDAGARLLVLLGGDGKGADFSALAPVLATGVRAAFVYGADAQRIYDVLADVLPTQHCPTLIDAVDAALVQAQPGDSVVLSPACASFDQFANFEARGDAFRQYVQELAA